MYWTYWIVFLVSTVPYALSKIGFFSDAYNSLKMLGKKNKTKRSSHFKAEERSVINLFYVLVSRCSICELAWRSLRKISLPHSPIAFFGILGPSLSSENFIMAASAAQTRVKQEVEKSIENLEKDHLRGLQVSIWSIDTFFLTKDNKRENAV